MKTIIAILFFTMMISTMAQAADNTVLQQQIPQYSQALFHDANTPVGGNVQGNVTLVEFFDYQCPHCREMAATVIALRAANPNLRIVYKDWPVFGGVSIYAAKAGMAAALQGKYEAFHDALMTADLPFSKEEVLSIAKSVGVDTVRLQQDMASPTWDAQLKANETLAKQFQLLGTPAFMIGKTTGADKDSSFLMPGPGPQSTLQQMITKSSGF